MIIELNGLPGSGKSFFANKIREEMQMERRKAINFSTVEKKFLAKVIYKIFANGLFFLLGKEHIAKSIEQKYTEKESKYRTGISVKSYLTRIVYLKYLYRLGVKSKRILILDEGMVQVLCAIYAEYCLDSGDIRKLFEYISEPDHGIIRIMYQFPIDQSIKSIRLRNRKVCGIDELNDGELREMLSEYSNLLSEYCHTGYDYLLLSREAPFEDNYEKLCGKMEEIMK